ncbi:MAG TPA: hypothetical protein VEF06_12485, partial [Bryobacteraceae bacterium]|nr:hypothetical protein [Bryobacteraceae bacterium]
VFDLPPGRSPHDVSAALKARGVLINGVNNKFMRALTHYDVTREDCVRAMDALEEVLRSSRSREPELEGVGAKGY